MFPTKELEKQLTSAQHKMAEAYPFEPGELYLGYVPDKKGRKVEVGIPTKRHAITIAGARSGKGVGVIIPNLIRWPHNALVIDPKGEAAEATAEIRERMGQAVHVLDPFGVADVPDRFKAHFNPLEGLDPNSRTIREDIGVISDGLVMRHDPRAAHWDGGALSVIAGLIGHVVDQAPPEKRSLREVRRLLTLPGDEFGALIDEMATNGACGNLPATAASKLLRSGSEAGHFLSGADENTKWLDSPAVGEILENSTFNLADLKTKPTTVYLVLPAHLLGEHGRFLRLFVRAALDAMAKGGTKSGEQCLFLLDEFYSLGRIDEIAKSAGLMPGYGVKLWPILQDLNQLVELYGREGAGTFFGNADLHQFFGNTDRETLEYISHRVGATTVDEIPLPPSAPMMSGGGGGSVMASMISLGGTKSSQQVGSFLGAMSNAATSFGNNLASSIYQDEMQEYQRQMAKVGAPRIAADHVAALVQLKNDVVADGSICFIYGSENHYVHLAPHFRSLPSPPSEAEREGVAPLSFGRGPLLWGAGAFVIAFVLALIARMTDGEALSLAFLAFCLGFIFKNTKLRFFSPKPQSGPPPLPGNEKTLPQKTGLTRAQLAKRIIGAIVAVNGTVMFSTANDQVRQVDTNASFIFGLLLWAVALWLLWSSFKK